MNHTHLVVSHVHNWQQDISFVKPEQPGEQLCRHGRKRVGGQQQQQQKWLSPDVSVCHATSRNTHTHRERLPPPRQTPPSPLCHHTHSPLTSPMTCVIMTNQQQKLQPNPPCLQHAPPPPPPPHTPPPPQHPPPHTHSPHPCPPLTRPMACVMLPGPTSGPKTLVYFSANDSHRPSTLSCIRTIASSCSSSSSSRRQQQQQLQVSTCVV